MSQEGKIPLSSSYTDAAIEEVYDLISNSDLWPKNWDNAKKMEMFYLMIEHYQETEQYEKCAELQRRLEEI
tara:strand:- start:217 stop:429 length:213 start_codon:yes stop_codon:yes gene_type:complete